MQFFIKSKYIGLICIASALLCVFLVGCGTNTPSKEPSTETTAVQNNETNEPEKTSEDSEKNTDSNTDKASAEETTNTTSEDELPKLSVTQEGVKLRWIDEGKLKMAANAKELSGNEIEKNINVNNFSAQLYENGKLTSSMTAQKAHIDANTRVITATGGVTIKSTERNTTVTAAWMKWFSKQNRVVGNGGVKITSEMGTIDAAAFEADTALKSLTVKDSTKGLEY